MRRRLLLSTLLAFPPSLACASGKADPNPKSLEIPAETALEAKALVEKLASKSFQEREQATRELQRLGRLALPAITEAMQSSANPEVQLRTELLLPSARTDDFRARIDCFLADTENKYRHDLPGAKEFFAVAGPSEAARNLFRDIVLSPNRDLLLGVGKPDELPKLIAERRAEFMRSINGGVVIINGVVQNNKSSAPTITDLAAIFFAESMIPEKKLGGQAGYQAASLLNQSALRTALNGGPEKDAILGILSKWADTREETTTMYYAMNSMKAIRPAMALKLATRILETKGGQPLYRGYAITTLGQHGDAEHREALVKMLKDESDLTPGLIAGGKRSPIQVRDLALAMLLVATKQDPTEYGFTYRYKTNPSSDALKYNYMAHYFEGDDAAKKREDAFKKWDEWAAKNKDALKK
jgi:hypothetical protein